MTFQETLAHAIVYGLSAVAILTPCVLVACAVGCWLIHIGVIEERGTGSGGAR